MGQYVTPEQVQQAKQIDLLTYLQLAAPQELVRIGNERYTTKTHDSVSISNGLWKRWSTGDGGKTAVDYLIKVEGFSFQEAVERVNALKGVRSWDVRPIQTAPPPKKEFVLPKKNSDNIRAIQYLKGRGIHPDVIAYCIRNGSLYEETKTHNVVFVGYENGQAKYAFRRGTYGKDFKIDAEGSNKKYGFCIAENPNATAVHVYECAIDLLSYCSSGRMVNADWKQDFHISQGGISAGGENENIGAALEEFLLKHPDIKTVYLRYDNDEKGRAAAQHTKQILEQKYGVQAHVKLPKYGKDYNEYLQDILQKFQNRTPVKNEPVPPSPSLQVAQAQPKRKRNVSR